MGLIFTKEAKLENLKSKFRKKYKGYIDYLDQFDCGMSMARTVSTVVCKYEAELNKLIEQMKELEVEINGKIPKALENVKFGDDGLGGIECN